jgi:pimeloyl-ACP methyl ester carboxylesterase
MNAANSPGQNWILLTGLSRESAHWGNFVPLLQSAFPDVQITLLDLPGAGVLYKEASPTSIKSITDAVRCFALDQGYLQQPATFLALSLGAMVAWEWMLNYPDEIAGAALIGASFRSVSPFYQRIRWQSYGKVAAFAQHKALYDREMAILQLISNRRDQYPHVIGDWLKIQSQRPVTMKNICRQILSAASYRPDPRKPGQPVLLLNSKGDRLVAPECSEAIAKQWNLELRTHPWAGHDLPLDDGAWVVSQLIDWLNPK